MDTSHSSIVESSSERSPKETKTSSGPTKTISVKYANKKREICCNNCNVFSHVLFNCTEDSESCIFEAKNRLNLITAYKLS